MDFGITQLSLFIMMQAIDVVFRGQLFVFVAFCV
jgi:hypothetical protein